VAGNAAGATAAAWPLRWLTRHGGEQGGEAAGPSGRGPRAESAGPSQPRRRAAGERGRVVARRAQDDAADQRAGLGQEGRGSSRPAARARPAGPGSRVSGVDRGRLPLAPRAPGSRPSSNEASGATRAAANAGPRGGTGVGERVASPVSGVKLVDRWQDQELRAARSSPRPGPLGRVVAGGRLTRAPMQNEVRAVSASPLRRARVQPGQQPVSPTSPPPSPVDGRVAAEHRRRPGGGHH